MESPQVVNPQPTTEAGQQPAAPAPKERISPQVQALMRKEQEAVRRMQQAKQLEAQLKTEREEIAKQRAEVEAFNTKWKDNPLKAVQERGLTPEQLWMMQQQGGQMTADVKIQMLQDELRQLRDERNGEKTAAQKAQEEQADREVDGHITAFKEEIGDHIEASKDKYPLTHLYKRGDLVYSVIDRHHEKTERETGTGVMMTVEEASKIVEARLLSEARKAQEILSKTAEAPAPQSAEAIRRRVPRQEAQPWVEKPLTTLAGIQQTSPSATNRYLSDEERTERALAKLRAAKQARGM